MSEPGASCGDKYIEQLTLRTPPRRMYGLGYSAEQDSTAPRQCASLVHVLPVWDLYFDPTNTYNVGCLTSQCFLLKRPQQHVNILILQRKTYCISYKSMAKNTHTASPDAISEIMSAVTTGLIMASTILGTTTYMILFFTLTSYLGRPLGVVFAKYVPPPNPVPPRTPEEELQNWQRNAPIVVPRVAAGFMWFVAFMIEFASILNEEQRTGVAYAWTFFRVIILIAKAGLAALIAVAVPSGIIRVAGLG